MLKLRVYLILLDGWIVNATVSVFGIDPADPDQFNSSSTAFKQTSRGICDLGDLSVSLFLSVAWLNHFSLVCK